MRVLMLVIPKGYATADEGAMPTAEMVAAMMQFNQALAEAGVLLSLDGLHPPAKGVRVSFGGGEPQVTHGPFPGTTEAVGGYWMVDVASLDDAVEWARRCPMQDGDVIELRQVQELADFPPEIQEIVQP